MLLSFRAFAGTPQNSNGSFELDQVPPTNAAYVGFNICVAR
jgi:hypothetical protein